MFTRSRLLGALCVIAAAIPSAAQTYQQDEVDRGLRSRRQIAKRIVKNGAADADARSQLQDYFEKYHLPAMTQASPEDLEDLEGLRVELFKAFIYEANGATQRYLSDKAKEHALKVINPRTNYHPAVTYNAVLVMGLIDSAYASGGAGSVPDAKANEVLCKLAAKAAANDALPSYMLVGALIGLERHARIIGSATDSRMPESSKQLTIKTLGGIIVRDQLAGEFEQGVRDWIYLKAARGLANLKEPGPRGAFVRAIAKRMADESLELETRVELASLLNRMKPERGQVNAAADALIALAVPVAETELEAAKKFEEMFSRGGRALADEGARDKTARRYRRDDQQRLVLVRGEMLDVLTGLQSGAKTLAPLVEGESAEKLTKIVDALGPAVTAAKDPEEGDLDVTDAVKQMATAVIEAASGEAPEEDDLFN